jgi:hypothetical protein
MRGDTLPAILALPGVPPEIDTAHVVRQMIRRAVSSGFDLWWKKAEEAGFCAHPIHLIGTDGLQREHRVLSRCNNRRALVCPSCSDLYASDTWQLIHAGLHGGHHGMPVTVAEHPQVFVTLTAPSFGAVHTIHANGTCHPVPARRRCCQNGGRAHCEAAHDYDETALGQPLCGDCYDYVGHVLFSWYAPELWRRFTIRVRRLLSQALNKLGENPDDVRVSFMKVVELQRRGLPHFHAVIRLDAASEPGEAPDAPDTGLSSAGFAQLVHQATDIDMTLDDGRVIGFGDQVDIKLITNADTQRTDDGHMASRRIARYLAKYVTKSVADFGVGVRPFPASAIDELNVTGHVRNILRTIVSLADHEPYGQMVSWLHTLGYRGHVMSKSRQFSTTMTTLRERRAAWRKEQTPAGVESALSKAKTETQWEFDRVGHITLGDRVLVFSAFAHAREQRFAARDALRDGA